MKNIEGEHKTKKKYTKRSIHKMHMSYLIVTLGVAICSFTYTFLLGPYYFDIGGVSGIGVILETHGYDPAVMIFIMNLVLLLFALIFVSKDFFIKNIYGSLLYPVFIKLFGYLYNWVAEIMPSIVSDINIVFVSIISSLLFGFGIGLCVKYGGSTGGTEIPQKILYDKFHIPYNLSLWIIDGLVIISGIIFIPTQKNDINLIIGELIFLFTNGAIMDITIFGGFNKKCVYIISDKWEEIKVLLLKEFDRGVTRLNVVGEYSGTEKKMLLCVLNNIEYTKLRELVCQMDSKAFLFCTRASEVRGEGFTYEAIDDLQDN